MSGQFIQFDPHEIRFDDPLGEIYKIKFDSDGGIIFESDGSPGRNILKLFDDSVPKVSIGYNPESNINIINEVNYNHPANEGSQILGDGEAPFIIASSEGAFESSGIYGDGDAITIWCPGDEAAGTGISAYLYILDEDRWGDDTNPYNGTALIAYMNATGTWVASDRNRKSNIQPFRDALRKIEKLSAYSYQFKTTEKELKKGDTGEKAIGLMAQEIVKIVPEAVNKTSEGALFVNYNMITSILVEALKEQQDLIRQLENRIIALEKD